MKVEFNRNFKTTYPTTFLDLLGREWHAEFFVSRVKNGCVGSITAGIRMDVERAVREALSLDY